MRSLSLEFPQEISRAFQEMLYDLNTLEKNSSDSFSKIGDDAALSVSELKKQLVELVGFFVKRVSGALPLFEKGTDEKLEFLALSFLDERFIRMETSLSDPWSENPLEKDAFGTRNAGSEVFERIDALSNDRLIDNYFALLYFLILSCGFAGKYDLKEDSSTLKEYKKNLYLMIEKSFNVSDVGSQATLQGSFLASGNIARSFLPTQRKFDVIALVFIVSLLILVQVFWIFKSFPIVGIAEQIAQIGALF
jgi:type IV/VI secretion system ImpK/VasF family protein